MVMAAESILSGCYEENETAGLLGYLPDEYVTFLETVGKRTVIR